MTSLSIKKALLSMPLLLFISFSSASAVDLDSCASIDKCTQRIYEVAEPPRSLSSGDISEDERAVATRIRQFGDDDVDRLIPMLNDANDDVAQKAAAALRDFSSIDKKHLPKIIEALNSEKDLGWLPGALGRIDSPLAAEEAVKRLIVSEGAPYNQEAYAVKLSGGRALPYIIKAAMCNYSCGKKIHYILGSVLGDMDDTTRTEAAKKLMDAISSDSITNEIKAGMIYMISFLKQQALVIEPKLISLKEKNSDFENIINKALIGIGSKQAGAIFADMLKIEPSDLTLIGLARLGPAGIDAGPIVTGLLNHSSRSIRLAAARCLGYIQYKESVPELIELLKNPWDVNLNWAAVESLGRIGDNASIKALEQISSSHWHPAVRKVASGAIKRIKSPAEYQFQPDCDCRDYFSVYYHLDIQTCNNIAIKKTNEPVSKKLFIINSEEKLKTLSYQMDRIPEIALRVEHGWLAGSDRGEFGGELVYIADGEKAVVVMKNNIENIYLLGERYIAVTGLAHLTSNRGMIYELTRTGNAGWNSRPWRSLPGAPRSSYMVETGELLVNTNGGGSILISPDGSMRMAPCNE